jgi:hypothetical protein
MAAVTPRFCWQNFAQFIGNLFTASSEDTAAPATFAIDQLRSMAWKTQLGWKIVTGFNDSIDITEGVTGDATAVLTAGNYATGALMAAEIQTRLNVAATDNTWTCTYSPTTFKFTIGHDEVQTGGIEWLTGTNTAVSAGEDLGYDITADDTGSGSYVADTVSYQSRHFLTAQLAASATVNFGAVLDHNISSSGTVVLHGNATDVWTAPSTSQTLSVADAALTIRSLFFSAGQTYAFWRFEFSDVTNPVGFQSIGLCHFGDYFQPTLAFGVDHTVNRDELTEIMEADQGAGFQDLKAKANIWGLKWNGITANDVASFETMANNRRLGRPLFFFFDPQNDATDGDYFHFSKAISRVKIPPTLWAVGVLLKQSLG